MTVSDQFKEPIITISALPERYKEFEIYFLDRDSIIASTVYGCLNGYEFTCVDAFDSFSVGRYVVMYPFDSDKPIYGKIISVKLEEEVMTVRVIFETFGGYELYKKKLLSMDKKKPH